MTEEEQFADTLTKKRQEIQTTLEQLVAARDAIENEEKISAQKSPMALVFELIGCQFYRYDFANAADRNIPPGQFVDHPCIRGKAHPDQDCRDCSYAQYGRYGGTLAHYEKRYPNHGVVIPVNEEEMDEIGRKVAEMDLKPLQRVQSRIHALEQILEATVANEANAKKAALEAQQRGQMPPRG